MKKLSLIIKEVALREGLVGIEGCKAIVLFFGGGSGWKGGAFLFKIISLIF